MKPAARALLLVLLLPHAEVTASLVAGTRCVTPAAAQSDDEDAVSEEVEPVPVNSASIGDLLALPGMDEDLARAILAVRDSLGGLSGFDELTRHPAITAARLMPLRELLLIEPERRTPAQWDAQATLRSVSSGEPRAEFRSAYRSTGRTAAVRIRRQAPENPEITFRASARIRGGVRVLGGDLTPAAGLGLLAGVSNRPPPRGVPAPAGAPSALPPPAGGRILRGVQLEGAGLFSFGHHAVGGWSTDSGRSGSAQILRLNPSAASGAPGVSPALIRHDGRFWSGIVAAGARSGTEWMLESARDPDGRWRHAVIAVTVGPAPVRVGLSVTGGAPDFLNPFGSDFESGRNDNRNEAALSVRARLRRGMAVEAEARAALERATTRRAWERVAGYGRARLEASLGSGWSVLSEMRMENRGAPGPGGVAEASLRRHTGVLRLGWERGGDHLRVEWQGKLDIRPSRDPAAPAVIDAVTDVVHVRGRRVLFGRLRIGGGVSRFRTPPAAPVTLYEERPRGLYPAVLVRGSGRRMHASVDAHLGPLTCGAFLARETTGEGPARASWGISLRAVGLFSQPLAPIDSRRSR